MVSDSTSLFEKGSIWKHLHLLTEQLVKTSTMYFIMLVTLATLPLCTSVEFSTAKPVIYVNMKDGTLDSSCWNKGLDLPCGSLELAIAGARKHNSTIDVLPFGSGELF